MMEKLGRKKRSTVILLRTITVRNRIKLGDAVHIRVNYCLIRQGLVKQVQRLMAVNYCLIRQGLAKQVQPLMAYMRRESRVHG